jgi:formylglycine-generating enzyme required for sulfatase activity
MNLRMLNRMLTIKWVPGVMLFGTVVAAAAGDVPPPGRTICAGPICMDVVDVGDPMNPPDPETGYGAVSYPFAIGRHEVTVDQYVTFLNATASRPAELPPGQREAIEELWQPGMLKTHDYVVRDGLIDRRGAGTSADPYSYWMVSDVTIGADSGHRPIIEISWFAAARFANWLHNGATAGSSTETGAYTLDYRRDGIVALNRGAKWWIPSHDEWYKAAYYDPTRPGELQYWAFPTRSDELPRGEIPPGGANSANFNSVAPEGHKLTPVGSYSASFSHYGTLDQAGLLWEWSDTAIPDHDGMPRTMTLLGGSWSLGLINPSRFGSRDYLPGYNDDDTGFRLATSEDVSP